MARKSKVGSRGVQYGPQSKKEEFHRDWGSYSIAKIHSVHEDLGLVVGLLDERTMGAIPIEWFIKFQDEWKPNGLACPYIYDENRRQWAIAKYNEIKDKIVEETEEEEDVQN